MFIARVPNRNSPPAFLLRESYRENGKVKTRTLANLSKLPPSAIEALKRSLKGEQLVPLDETLEKFGNGTVAGTDTFTLDTVQIGTTTATAPAQADIVRDWFAPAEYFDMGEDEKLSSPSYMELQAGVFLGRAEERHGNAVNHVPGFEEIMVDPEMNSRQRRVKGEAEAPGPTVLGPNPSKQTDKGRFSLRPAAQRVAGTHSLKELRRRA